jgi:cytochrome b involved in lipid metabolism
MSTFAKAGLLVIAALTLTACTASSDTSNSSGNNVNPNSSGDIPSGKTFTAAEVSTHSTEPDCWMIISAKVYNVTTYVNKHPGGDEILQGCGKDATSMFESRPDTGVPHSRSAESLLESYYIGDLAN